MKFRTATIWITLISTGMLCLAVGAVRIPRKPRTAKAQTQPAAQSTNLERQSTPAAVIPMQVSQPTNQSASSNRIRQREAFAAPTGRHQATSQQPFQHQPAQQRRDAGFSNVPHDNPAAGTRFGATGTYVTAPTATSNHAQRQQRSGYQEPEAWPFHRSSNVPSSRTSQPQQSHSFAEPQQSQAGGRSSAIADWPYQRSGSRPANTQSFQAMATDNPVGPSTVPQQPAAAFDPFPSSATAPPATPTTGFSSAPQQTSSHQQRATSNDLLNPALAFGGPLLSATTTQPPVATNAPPQTSFGPASFGPDSFEPTQSQQSPITKPFAAAQQPALSRVTDPFGAAPAQPSNPQLPAPSLANLPSPQPSPGQTQDALTAGHAGQNNQVIQAYAESVTPRNYVTVGQWSGPQSRPVQSIQQVSFDSCPDCEDVNRIPAESLINPYAARANGYPTSAALPRESGQLVELPRDYAPWWEEAINKPLRAAPATHPINVESLIFSAIQHSPQVTAFRIDPIIRETQILEEAAEFDWQSFLETRFDDSNDPIGNELTTGNDSDRFTDKHLTSRFGVEKRLAQGGTFDITQKFGVQRNNSEFFIPRQQGTSRLELNFTQPLLRGAGQTYNESRTILAMLDHQISEDELQDSLQDHLLEVYTTYWNLYRARAVRLQKERLLRRAIDVEQKLTARQGIDSVRRQVLRARAAIASRRSEIARADMEVRNAESRLRLLVNSPGLKQSTVVELLPVEAPMSEHLTVSMRGSVETALQNRPDIRRAITQMKETAVRLEVSKNELLPKMDLVLGTYVAGLRGENQIDTAWAEQFRDGRPGYTVGLMVQYPLGNRAAKARYAKREWEVAKTLKEFEASVESGMSEVELAVREFETSYQEMLSRFQSMIAADTEANYLLERWRLLPGNDQTTSFLLEDLLDAQERVAMEEQDFVEAQVAYVLSVVRLKRASGILLSCDCGNSPVSFMTPAPRGLAQPNPLPQPVHQRPALPAPQPANTKLTPPLPVLPKSQSSRLPPATLRSSTPRTLSTSENDPSIIPFPGPTTLPVPPKSQL